MVSDQENIQQETQQKRTTTGEGNSQDSLPSPTRPRRGGEPPARSGSQLPAAIFPHRALEKRKREVKTSFGLCFEWIQKDYNRNCYKMHVKIIIFGPKTFKISSNWHPKSMSKPWKIEVVSRMRFWSGPWVPKGGCIIYPSYPFWEPFSTKTRKKTSKKACKNQCRKSIGK